MKWPRFRLSTLCLLVVIAALSLGLVVTMVRHDGEVTQLKILTMREQAFAAQMRVLAEVARLQELEAQARLDAESKATKKAIEALEVDSPWLALELRTRPRTQRMRLDRDEEATHGLRNEVSSGRVPVEVSLDETPALPALDALPRRVDRRPLARARGDDDSPPG